MASDIFVKRLLFDKKNLHVIFNHLTSFIIKKKFTRYIYILYNDKTLSLNITFDLHFKFYY